MKTEQKCRVKVVTTTLSKPIDKLGATNAAKAIKAQLRGRGVRNAAISIVKV